MALLIEYVNNYEENVLSQELVAAIQIIQADYARTDLLLLPATIHLSVTLQDVEEIRLHEIPSNRISTWKIELPRSWIDFRSQPAEIGSHIIAVVNQILYRCSLLEEDVFNDLLRDARKGA